MDKIYIYEKLPFIFAVLIVIYLIIKDSLKVYGKNKTIAFFVFGILYSILRVNFINLVMLKRHGIPDLPYQVNLPLIKILGTTPVEISGWLIVSYLSLRLSNHLLKNANFLNQIVLCSLFIASISFAVETTAIEGDWWRWKVILGDSIFGKVPTIGIQDWGFVAFDFLFPFSLFFIVKSNIFLKIFSLLIFPTHFYLHIFIEQISSKILITPNIFYHILIPFLILFFGVFFNLKRENESSIKYPLISTIIITVTLILYNIYFKITPKLYLSILPLFLFVILCLNKKHLNIIFGVLSLFLTILFKEATPSLILFISFCYLIFEIKNRFLKTLYIIIPFLCLCYLGNAEGKRAYLSNKAITKFNEAYGSQRWDEAKKLLEECLKIEPRHPVGNFLMAEYYLKKEKNFDKAEYYYKKSMQFYQHFRESLIQLVQLYIEKNRIDEAYEIWKKGYPFHKDDPVILYLGYRIYWIKGDKRKSDYFINEVYKRTSIENYGRFYLASVMEIKGEDEAERKALECIKNKINVPDCLQFLWDYYNFKNDLKKLEELKKMIGAN